VSCASCSSLPLDATIGAEADLRRALRGLRLALSDGTLSGGGTAVEDLSAGRAEGQVDALFECRR
jgi:hypothetical protein